MTKPIALVIAGFFIAFFLISSSSCNKDTSCKATIRCVDSIGNPINNASVLLYAVVKTPTAPVSYTADVKANGSTDGSGEVKFTFKLPAIYDILANASAAKTYSGSGIIKLEEGKTIEKVVILR